ncbi:hypothetical protein C4K11_2415 [Pseudomonas chlororaphis subsp. aureofaciens]|nr:hypothetical protein C4K13_2448 [Pseudomonas chlororaphis subsp. aureofaciens]AZD98347.1 hypothetical protein C4K12_2481 [Pseudomonas chlororaphis subsp. aureofaciens]AZE04577.1 hypothetical protein C4K11_2415 [Pseudomonas chlororaphis subsp. aureofaciens]AZE35491.1 hypothetical protein C4K06_2458 [Pseudomonas chlororaphis subsp. aureofaciens]
MDVIAGDPLPKIHTGSFAKRLASISGGISVGIERNIQAAQ